MPIRAMDAQLVPRMLPRRGWGIRGAPDALRSGSFHIIQLQDCEEFREELGEEEYALTKEETLTQLEEFERRVPMQCALAVSCFVSPLVFRMTMGLLAVV